MSIRSIFSNSIAFLRTSSRDHQYGFLTVELLISIGIMALISSTVLSANSNMSGRLETDNLAHLIALSIREAQVKSLSAVAENNSTDSAVAFPAYGVSFNSGNQASFTVFKDVDKNGAYTDAAGEAIETKTLGGGMKLNRVCAVANPLTPGGGTNLPCDLPTTAPPFGGTLNIVFRRPRLDAIIQGGASQEAQIVVTSPKGGYTKTIHVSKTGQISVQ